MELNNWIKIQASVHELHTFQNMQGRRRITHFKNIASEFDGEKEIIRDLSSTQIPSAGIRHQDPSTQQHLFICPF
jgi:hypothetical protein